MTRDVGQYRSTSSVFSHASSSFIARIPRRGDHFSFVIYLVSSVAATDVNNTRTVYRHRLNHFPGEQAVHQ